MFTRQLAEELQRSAEQYPVVTLMGPRQSGKTTLIRQLFPNKTYINLEAPNIRQMVQADPIEFLNQHTSGVILDEIQRVPELLSYIQVKIDDLEFQGKPCKGLFILTGSHQTELHQAIAQSLAGRTAIHRLLPLCFNELNTAGIHLELDEYLLRGFYPRIYKDNLSPTQMYQGYFETYVEKDIRQLIHIKELQLFEKFIRLCAGRIGQILVYQNLSNELGVSGQTIKQWLSVLEASFLVVQLKPYYENLGKRLIKSNKLYFTDVGLACYLLGIENVTQLIRDPLRGHLIENMVILDLIKWQFNHGKEPNLYFYRDQHHHEVDVIFKKAHELIPIEIKASQTFHLDFLKGIEYFRALNGDRVPTGYLVYTGQIEQKIQGTKLINYKNATQLFES